MRTSRLLLRTVRETPADAAVISHRLMLRAAIIRPLASGLYSWLPLGVRVLRRIEAIVREEMERAGAQELLMPMVQPAELWRESGRWDEYGPELLRFADRHGHPCCLGPTHEEVVTDIVRRELGGRRQLPLNLFQIQHKFRDEIRPRFGVMRAREFVMKDAYSFHLSAECLARGYEQMRQAYSRAFDRIGLDWRMVEADNGSIGGSSSHEFHVLASSGEDSIAVSDDGDYAANLETVPCPPAALAADGDRQLEELATPGITTIDALAKFLKIQPQHTLKTLMVEAAPESGLQLVALMLRGDHSLNPIKAERLGQVAKPLRMATAGRIREVMGAPPGSLGPVGLDAARVGLVVDHGAAAQRDMTAGANREGFHYKGIQWRRDCGAPPCADLRMAGRGDAAPDGRGRLQILRGIEVGHIFQLGDKYARALGLSAQDESGADSVLQMGCYGIGITRIAAAAIEQGHDERGIIWPDSIAPYRIALIGLGGRDDRAVRAACEQLYKELCELRLDVLYFDRPQRPGVMLADADLIGIPHRLVVGAKSLARSVAEYSTRRQSRAVQEWPLQEAAARLADQLG